MVSLEIRTQLLRGQVAHELTKDFVCQRAQLGRVEPAVGVQFEIFWRVQVQCIAEEVGQRAPAGQFQGAGREHRASGRGRV